LVTRNTPTLKELCALETEGRKMGLRINEEKTKYLNVLYTSKKISPKTNNR
jgi:hypothetical protein